MTLSNPTDADSRNGSLIVKPQGQALAYLPNKAVSPSQRSKTSKSSDKQMKKKTKTCLGKFAKHVMVHFNHRCFCKRCGLCPLGVMW